MKKINLNGKLSLKKETIAKLNDKQMNLLKGGIGPTMSCQTCNNEQTCQVVIIHTTPVGCAIQASAGGGTNCFGG